MSAIINKNSLTNWMFSDYENDKNYQPFFSCSGASLRGRLISLADIPSQAIRGTASIIGGIFMSLACIALSIYAKNLKGFSIAILTFTAGNLWVLATKTFVIVGDILGIFVPQMGRKARTLVRLFDTAFLNSYNDMDIKQDIFTTYKAAASEHTNGPQTFYVGLITKNIIEKLWKADSEERPEIYDRLNTTIQGTYEDYKDKTGSIYIEATYDLDVM